MIFLRDVLSGETNKDLRGTGSQLRRPHVPLKLPLLATPAYRGSFFICEGMDYKALCCRNIKNIDLSCILRYWIMQVEPINYISYIFIYPKAVCDQLLSSTSHPLLCIQMLQSGDRRMVLPDGKRRFRHMICASWCHRTHCLRRSRVCVNGIKQAHESYRNRSVSGSTILLISVTYHFYILLQQKN